MEIITIILAIGASASPIIFGFLYYKMDTRYITRIEFTEYKLRADQDRAEIKEELRTISADIKKLLSQK